MTDLERLVMKLTDIAIARLSRINMIHGDFTDELMDLKEARDKAYKELSRQQETFW